MRLLMFLVPLVAVVVALALLFRRPLLDLLRRIFPDIFTGAAPVRAPHASYNGISLMDPVSCDGSYSGSGTIAAVYPATPAGRQAVTLDVRLQVVDVRNTSTSFKPQPADPISLTFDHDEDSFSFKGTLLDPCLPGLLRFEAIGSFRAGVTGSGSPDASPVELDVPAVGFRVTQGIQTAEIDNANFRVTLELKCCNGHNFTVSDRERTNIQSLSFTPNPATLACPSPAGGPINTVLITINGTKADPQRLASFKLVVDEDVLRGRHCTIGTVIVEGR